MSKDFFHSLEFISLQTFQFDYVLSLQMGFYSRLQWLNWSSPVGPSRQWESDGWWRVVTGQSGWRLIERPPAYSPESRLQRREWTGRRHRLLEIPCVRQRVGCSVSCGGESGVHVVVDCCWVPISSLAYTAAFLMSSRVWSACTVIPSQPSLCCIRSCGWIQVCSRRTMCIRLLGRDF